MQEAETLLNTNPDSALSLLREIDASSINNPRNRARYALLMSAALDKNYIDVQSDSLINIAVEFFSEKGSARDRMLTWYYQGIVLKNAHNYVHAIVSFEKAEKEAEKMDDRFYLGLIFRNKASLNSFVNNNPAAIWNLKKAIELFDDVEAHSYKEYAELSLAIDYSNQFDFKKSDSLLNALQLGSKDSVLLAHCILRQASNLVMQDMQPEKAIELYRHSPLPLFNIFDYAYLAQAFELTNECDSADYWFSKGYQNCKDQPDSASLDYLRARIELSRGHFENAFHLIDYATTVQDSLTRVLLQQSVSASQRDYYKNETILREVKIRNLQQRNAFGITLSLIILSLLTLATISASRKKDRILQEQMARHALEERELERVNRDNAFLIGSLFSEKIHHLDKLSETYFQLDEGKQKDTIFKQIKQLVSTIRKDDGLFLSLEKDLDRYCNGIVSKLREQVPRIKGENLRIITLFFAGFSYETVQIILNKVSIESLKMTRSRFRKDIKESNAPDRDLFLKMLEMKRKRPLAGTNENN